MVGFSTFKGGVKGVKGEKGIKEKEKNTGDKGIL
jgi:hypothetical protein